VYVGVSKGQSFGLTKTSNDTILLRDQDVMPFFPKTLLDGLIIILYMGKDKNHEKEPEIDTDPGITTEMMWYLKVMPK